MRRTAELIGETVREIGILISVFAPLDTAFHEGRFGGLTMVWLAVLQVAGMVLIVTGIMLERRN